MTEVTREIEAILAAADDWRGTMLSQLRGIVLGADGGLREDVKSKKPSRPEGVPVWSAGGIVCIGEMLKRAVRLTFPHGARLDDATYLFNARLDSASVRAVDFYEGDTVPADAVADLVRQAAALTRR